MTSLRDLPSVHVLAAELPGDLPSSIASDLARAAIDQAREAILAGDEADPRAIAISHAEALAERRPTSVINATGVLLHTNLGRAPLDPAAADAARVAATEYTNLEMRLDTGARGGRGDHATRLAASITGAESALIVNNNAGALFLVLASLAGGREVPVSRGELIEIGGSYRLPELMAASGAVMVEVGTTNRTRAGDYERAVRTETGAILKVHPSNYRIDGFTEEATVSQLAPIAGTHGVPLVFDAGSGLIDAEVPWITGPPPPWVAGEPGIVQSLQQGADLVMFSGDKLLGGPQAGIVVGSAHLIDRMRKHPVARAMRIDGPSLAALDVTLDRYARGEAATLPFWRMATTTQDELAERCTAIIDSAGIDAIVQPGWSTLGAGSVPGSRVPSPVIVVTGSTDTRFFALLRAEHPVVARREEGSLVLDVRSVPPEHDAVLAATLGAVCRS